MRALHEAMGRIETSSDATARLVRTIDEIAFQANLLALNAAVEAADTAQELAEQASAQLALVQGFGLGDAAAERAAPRSTGPARRGASGLSCAVRPRRAS